MIQLRTARLCRNRFEPAAQEIGCPTLFATHFHELTSLSGPVGVSNLHVETAIDAQTGSLTMLYQASIDILLVASDR